MSFSLGIIIWYISHSKFYANVIYFVKSPLNSTRSIGIWFDSLRLMKITLQYYQIHFASFFRHAVALVGLCSVAAPLSDLTTWTFAIDSLPFNAYMVYLSYKFYRQPDANTSRTLFRYSLIYLPAIMLLMVVSSYGRAPPKDDVKAVKVEAHLEQNS